MENFRDLPAEKEMQYRGRLLLIWNPVAGKKQSKRYLPDIIALYSELGYRVEVVATRGPGSVPHLIRRFGHEADRIVTIGGDGTFNETISGVLREGLDVPLGYIPAGSTNDLASSLSLSSNIMTAAREAVLGEAKTLDVGLFNGRPFSYIAGFGAFTATSYSTPQNLKNLLGHTAYVLSGINELSNIHPHHVKITTEDETFEDDYIFGAIVNSLSIAGVISLDPKLVSMNDGLFELMLIKMPRTLIEMQKLAQDLIRKDYTCKSIRFLKAADIHIEAPESLAWTLDGEKESGCSSIHIKNLHSAISLAGCKME